MRATKVPRLTPPAVRAEIEARLLAGLSAAIGIQHWGALMGKRAFIVWLPDALREELERRLIASHFTGYDEIAHWLASQGHPISKSSVHRYGSKLERRLQGLREPVTPVQRIDEAIKRETTRRQQAKVRQETGVFVLVIDPPTRETTLYASVRSAAQVQRLIEKALFDTKKIGRRT